MNDDNNGKNHPSSNPAFLTPQRIENREAILERILRELVWRSDYVRTILLRDRENTDFDHITDLLDTHHIHDILNIKPNKEDE